ncbi:MAG: motility associated factor glycosyltransferase family protein [Lachnospiraceae bacterium]|nr:motility associated factor glycosyltransferase family protein [Lachnospiraceae bacterium]
MTIFEKNLKIIQEDRPLLYSVIMSYNPKEQIYLGDALYNGQFMAIEREGQMVAMQSTYDPEHEADAYIRQFSKIKESANIVLFGFGDGEIVRRLLSREEFCTECIVFEPSIDIFNMVLHNYEIEDILGNPRFDICIVGEDDDACKEIMYQKVSLYNYKSFRYHVLSKYSELFSDKEKNIRQNFEWVCDYMQANYNTMVRFAFRGPTNSIFAFRYFLHAKNVYGIKPYLRSDIPCFIISAGPSLHKNIQQIKRAKGKSFLICVDSAANFCIEEGIIPDAICIVDPVKGDFFSLDERLHKIPILVCTAADHRYLNKIGMPEIMYFSIDCKIHNQILQEYEYQLPYNDKMGSVAISAFQLAVELGFHTIIMMGQDLAYSGNQMYVGENNESILNKLKSTIEAWGLYEAEGYDGGTVYTTGDFYAYIEWYADYISRLEDRNIINSTEGGARIPGALQMTAEEAIDKYCITEFDFSKVYHELPYMVDPARDIDSYMMRLQTYHKKLVVLCDRISRLTSNDHNIQQIIDQVQYGDFSDLFHRNMIEAEIEYLNTSNSDHYIESLKQTGKFIKETWQQMMEEIECLYLKKI